MKTNMKRLILIAVVGLLALGAKSQTNTDQAILTLRLNPIQSITVNSGQKETLLDYRTVDNYERGVSVLQYNHLKVFSTGAFLVEVSSDVDQFKNIDSGDQTVEASTFRVKASAGTNNPIANQTMGDISLSTKPTPIINSGVGGFNRYYNVTYSGMGANTYINRLHNQSAPTIYSAIVIYTITPL